MRRQRPKRLPVAEQIRKGLEEAILHARGELSLKTTILELPEPPPEIQAGEVMSLRRGHQMSQAAFARLLNVSTRTVQNWEQGSRKPSQAALRLIQVFREDPDGLLRLAGINRSAKTVPHARPPLRRRDGASEIG
jgi:putative transcriptional regulator